MENSVLLMIFWFGIGGVKAGEAFDNCLENGGHLLTAIVCLPMDYEKARQPYEKVMVETVGKLKDVRELDQTKLTIKSLITMNFYWQEPRLIFNISNFTSLDHDEHHHHHRHLTSSVQNFGVLWTPEFKIAQHVQYQELYVRYEGGLLTIYPVNETAVIVWTLRSLITTSCHMEFHDFPFDIQDCELEFGSTAPTDRVEFFVSSHSGIDRKSSVLKEFTIGLEQYRRSFMWKHESSLAEGTAENYSVIGYKINLRRNSWPYVWSYYLPVCGMMFVGSISFWIPPDSIPGRVALLVTLSLVLISIFNSIQAQIPKTRNLTALSIYVLTALIFVFAALFEFAFILFRKRRASMIEKKRKRSPGWTVKIEAISNDTFDTEDSLKEDFIDQIAFILYIGSIFLFNFVYGWVFFP